MDTKTNKMQVEFKKEKEQRENFLNEFLERMYPYTKGNEDEIALKRRLITIGYNLANEKFKTKPVSTK